MGRMMMPVLSLVSNNMLHLKLIMILTLILKLITAATLKVKVMSMTSSILRRMTAVKKMKPLVVQLLMVILDQVDPSRTCDLLTSLHVPLNTEDVRMIIKCPRKHS
jgi:hypothetical protein